MTIEESKKYPNKVAYGTHPCTVVAWSPNNNNIIIQFDNESYGLGHNAKGHNFGEYLDADGNGFSNKQKQSGYYYLTISDIQFREGFKPNTLFKIFN